MHKRRRETFIRAWRKHRGYTLENLAERIGVTHPTLSRVERGLLPFNQDLLELLAEQLMCEPADLLMRDPTDPNGIWSIWDNAKPGERRQIVELAKVIVGKTGAAD
jgi:transcriptional regulator with XRE-family HTH domain